MKLTGHTCIEAMSEAEEAERRESSEGNAGEVRVERRVRPTVSHEQCIVEAMVTSILLGILACLLGSVVRHRKSLALVVIIFLVRTIECFKECFLLVRSIFLNLRFWQIAIVLYGITCLLLVPGFGPKESAVSR
jgi:hypothetical protein